MLDIVKRAAVTFEARDYWASLWSEGDWPISIAGFQAVLRPLCDDDDPWLVRGPCKQEDVLASAVAQWRVQDRTCSRWTYSLDGWRGFELDGEVPPHVLAAIETAYPLPSTFAEAHAEYGYWRWRSYMSAAILYDNTDGWERPELDLTALARALRVRDLVLHELPVASVQEAEIRFRLYRAISPRDGRIEVALSRDLAALAGGGGEYPSRDLSSRPAGEGSGQVRARTRSKTQTDIRPPSKNGQIQNALEVDPTRTDRSIALEVGCSATTVGKVRTEIGLTGTIRSVRRGGQTYRLSGKSRSRQASAEAQPARSNVGESGQLVLPIGDAG